MSSYRSQRLDCVFCFSRFNQPFLLTLQFHHHLSPYPGGNYQHSHHSSSSCASSVNAMVVPHPTPTSASTTTTNVSNYPSYGVGSLLVPTGSHSNQNPNPIMALNPSLSSSYSQLKTSSSVKQDQYAHHHHHQWWPQQTSSYLSPAGPTYPSSSVNGGFNPSAFFNAHYSHSHHHHHQNNAVTPMSMSVAAINAVVSILPNAGASQRKSRRCRCPNCLSGFQPIAGNNYYAISV